mgnify:CR=1 FL=1
MEKTKAFMGLRVKDKDKWFEFIHTIKKNKTKAWDVLEPFIDEYIKKKVK